VQYSTILFLVSMRKSLIGLRNKQNTGGDSIQEVKDVSENSYVLVSSLLTRLAFLLAFCFGWRL
jgi:hypothetical protein